MQGHKWTGRPEYRPFLTQQMVEMGGTIAFNLGVYALCYLIQNTLEHVITWSMLHVVLGFIFLSQAYRSIKRMLEYKYLHYRISEDTVEIVKGKNQEDIKAISKETIQFVHAKRSFADKIYGTKTIKLYTGELTSSNDEQKKSFDQFENIKDDKEVLSLLNIPI